MSAEFSPKMVFLSASVSMNVSNTLQFAVDNLGEAQYGPEGD
jgi:hypothetical protein